MRPMNGGKPQARELIERLMASERVRSSSHFSERVYASEPILTTGRQMASYVPEKYRELHGISRWEPGADGRGGRWLTDAELFYRQGMFMADWEDDCPYHGTFKSYFPTYDAMSDRQLRGYFTWRAGVRRGEAEVTSLSFAYLYMYELLNGIGVSDARDGLDKLVSFWRTYRVVAPEIDRFAEAWILDYVVYHGLPAEIISWHPVLEFDSALIALRRAEARALGLPDPSMGKRGPIEPVPAYRGIPVRDDGTVLRASEDRYPAGGPAVAPKRRKKGESALPLPVDVALEDELLQAIDALSTHRLTTSRLFKSHPEALRHVAGAVFVRMSEYSRKHRKATLLESWFGEEVALTHTMFASAVFFEPAPHADAVYELDEVHRYECRGGNWLCERFHGSRGRSPKLGALMRSVDRCLREALGFAHPLKENGKTPKYVQKFIDEEIAAWLAWSTAHAPRRIAIDLGQLGGIRAAAALTRESLLIDEEREGAGALLDAAEPSVRDGCEALAQAGAPGAGRPESALPSPVTDVLVEEGTLFERSIGSRAIGAGEETRRVEPGSSGPADGPKEDTYAVGGFLGQAGTATVLRGEGTTTDAAISGLTRTQIMYLHAVLEGDAAARARAVGEAGGSEDLLVDAINEALFDLVGDTVLEYGADGPAIIDDYRIDVEEMLDHA